MTTKTESLIEISGISKELPLYSNCFKQLHIQSYLILNQDKPDINNLIRLFVKAKIFETRIIKTPMGTSSEGQFLSGIKLLVEGKVIQALEYMSDDMNRCIQATHFYIPFSNFIILEEQVVSNAEIKVDVYLEDIYVKQINRRELFNSILLLLNVSYL